MYYINDFYFLIENDIINDIDRFLFFVFWLSTSYYILIMNLCNLWVLLFLEFIVEWFKYLK